MEGMEDVLTGAATQTPEAPQADTDAGASKKARDKGSIQFPYSDLESGIEVVKAIHPQGNECRVTQLAVWMGHTDVGSGAFRLRLSTARIFGLVEVNAGTVILTPLGRWMADPARERDA